MLLVAIGIAVWKTYIWEPPTNLIAGYEKAPILYGTTATIGPNQIRILSVSRNDRDGSILIENGRGKKIEAKIPYRKELSNSGAWLDVVQIDLLPRADLVDITEIRIFEHATREMLRVNHPRCGYRLVEPNVIQLYGLGGELPGRIDLWLRLHSYDKSDPVYKLPPRKGASVELTSRSGASTVAINDVQQGYRGWSSADGFFPVDGEHQSNCAFEIGWTGTADVLRYQVGAVTKDGRKLLDSRFLSYTSDGKSPIEFYCRLDDIDHLEMRPFGGGHRFFFDGLQLPKTGANNTGATFADPPTAVVNVDQELENFTPIAAFAPLDIRIIALDGRWFTGSAAGQNYLQLIPHPNGPKDVGTSFTRVVESRGLADPPYALRMRSISTGAWVADTSVETPKFIRAVPSVQPRYHVR